MATKHRKLHFLIIDDNPSTTHLYKKLLENAGQQVSVATSSIDALAQIPVLKPNCILYDLSEQTLDGIQLYQDLSALKDFTVPAFILIANPEFAKECKFALKAGISGYLTKPIEAETFYADILEILDKKMVIQFWGVRGTLPVPGKKTMHYGGNTNCVTLSFAKKEFFIFDAGTGIKELSNYFLKQNKFPVSAKIFISHPHYDHIHGIPLFFPLYMPGNEFEIFGTNHNDMTIDQLIAGQMDTIYFPVTIKEFSANLTFHTLREETFQIGELQVSTIFLNHPGKCIGYRIQYQDKSFCYMTDNELYLEDSPLYKQADVDRLIQFLKGADVVIMDSTYFDEEYMRKIGWGHSCISRVVDIADRANVKLLCLYHHDPDQFDHDVDIKLQHAKSLLKLRNSKTRCIAPCEGDRITL